MDAKEFQFHREDSSFESSPESGRALGPGSLERFEHKIEDIVVDFEVDAALGGDAQPEPDGLPGFRHVDLAVFQLSIRNSYLGLLEFEFTFHTWLRISCCCSFLVESRVDDLLLKTLAILELLVFASWF